MDLSAWTSPTPLSDAGFRVAEAGNADEAMKIMMEDPSFSALLTDIDMPGKMNGIALATHVATNFKDCRIIVISGRYHPGQGQLPEGAQFLVKPISQAALLSALSKAGLEP